MNFFVALMFTASLPFIKDLVSPKLLISLSALSRNNIIGSPFVELISVDSTNNYAMRRVKEGVAAHGTAYFAFEQTAGKGQRNKHWHSAKGENIILSVVLETEGLLLSQQFVLSVIAALSAVDLFNNYTTYLASIKWPNDIYFGDRKAGGILIETVVSEDQCRFAVIGFGLNINQTVFDDSLKNPTSLKQVTQNNYNIRTLSEELCGRLEQRFQQFQKGEENVLLGEYNQLLYKRDLEAKFKKDTRIFSGTIKRVDRFGRLTICNSMEETLEFGTVEWLIT